MKPHIKRYYYGKSLGWVWGLFAKKNDLEPMFCAIYLGTISYQMNRYKRLIS